eukprot:m.20369 g.20369  ORF g.20369 m.20369 type:complete len:1166 (+) comp3785_c0_seq1:132-3629(+)
MFIYLNKKIKIELPDPIDVNALSWNREQGWIVIGGDKGLLKVLKLEDMVRQPAMSARAQTVAGKMAMNQNLEGHQGNVQVVTWNETYRKLTTSDEHGLIIVWFLFKGKWYEEMINNRNVSFVRDMSWCSDGRKICIAYEDGHVIVGEVGGNRLWGDTLDLRPNQVAWSPDSKRILLGTIDGEVHVYDDDGNFQFKIDVSQCLEGLEKDVPPVVCIDWYNGEYGFVEENCPALCICFKNGRLQIMDKPTDPHPVLIDTEMTVAECRWNQRGTVLAIAGTERSDSSANNVLQFYSPHGDNLRTLKVPGQELRSLTWEGAGLRLALAVDHFIYFANVRPDYNWGFFSDTIVYAFTTKSRAEHCVVFWDTKLNGHQVKFVRSLTKMAAAGNYTVLATRSEEEGQYVLILCNKIGQPIDSKYIDIEPVFLAMSESYVVAASHDCIFVWSYEVGLAAEAAGKKSRRDEKIFHADDAPSTAKEDWSKFRKAAVEAQDAVSCITVSDSLLLVGKESGLLQEYGLPGLSLGNRHFLECRPDSIALNCNSTKVSIIDIGGVMMMYDLTIKHTDPESGGTQTGSAVVGFERKDVWNMRWADDDPDLFAIMERTRMYIFRGSDPEEPVESAGWICNFKDLQVQSVLLDDVMRNPEHPTKEHIVEVEIKSLRDTRNLIDSTLHSAVKTEDVASFIEDNPHPRLWRLLAESALSKLDLDIAERSFVKCMDFPGIDFVKRLRDMDDEGRQAAEVAVYFHRFEEAEARYLRMQREDLAKQLRYKLGDWFRVVKLMNMGGTNTDVKGMEHAWNQIGNYYADRLKWEKAADFFFRGNNTARLAECYFMTENYAALEKMIVRRVPDTDPLLSSIAEMFASVGLCDQAVEAYTKRGQYKEAIQTCVKMNNWGLAVDLAYSHPDQTAMVEGFFTKYASHLREKGNVMEAVELYAKARHYLDAAKLLYNLAAEQKDNPLRAKKLYVLGALHVERYRDHARAKSDDPTRSALDGLEAEDAATPEQTKMIDTAWRGAEAFHFLMLAQRQLYSGKFEAALTTALALVDYDDLVPSEQVYSIYALAAIASKKFDLCSKAFTKLESLPHLSDKMREQYEDLALSIFTAFPKTGVAQDAADQPADGFRLSSVVTGRHVIELDFWLCGTCQHRAGVQEISSFKTCPLCHAPTGI